MAYKYKQKIIRINYSTYLRIKRCFPAHRGETMNNYFERLSKFLGGDND